MEQTFGRVLARWVGSFVLGVVIAVVGTGIHRSTRPWGLVGALVVVLLGGVVTRAWSGLLGMLALALGVGATTAVLGSVGPGADVVVAADVWGYVWYLGALVVPLALVLPRSWFREERAQSAAQAVPSAGSEEP